jgi:hypothetical protein
MSYSVSNLQTSMGESNLAVNSPDLKLILEGVRDTSLPPHVFLRGLILPGASERTSRSAVEFPSVHKPLFDQRIEIRIEPPVVYLPTVVVFQFALESESRGFVASRDHI